jgi:hypothetical protein
LSSDLLLYYWECVCVKNFFLRYCLWKEHYFLCSCHLAKKCACVFHWRRKIHSFWRWHSCFVAVATNKINNSHHNLHSFLLKECALLTSGLFTDRQCLLQETRLTNVQQLCHEFVQLLFLMRV